jgi:hypothetical protein
MMTTDNSRQRLIDAVLEQIKDDVQRGDMTAVEELICKLPTQTLVNYLPE